MSVIEPASAFGRHAADPGPSPGPKGSWLERWYGLGALWGLFAAIYVAVILIARLEPYDGDDLVRLQQVRDLLAGQSWYDVTQYRMNPPHGAAMHWSRLVDIPLVGVTMILATVLPSNMAEYWASVLVPLLYLGAAMTLLRAIMMQLGFTPRTALGGLALALLFPLLPAAFAPMRIDHHSAQAVLGLVCALMLLRAPDYRAALCGGVAAAAWLVISLEGLPLVALLAALYGWRYAVKADRSLGWFLLALAGAAAALSLATRPPGEFAQWCDILLPAHWAAFAIAAGAAFGLAYLPGQHHFGGRSASLGALPLACAPLILMLPEGCRAGPLAAIDPLVEAYWYRNLHEGMPVWRLAPEYALSAIYLVALVAAGWWSAKRIGLMQGADKRLSWQVYGGLAFGAAGYGLLLQRAGLNAQLLALPLVLALLSLVMPRARAIAATLPRAFATAACLVLVTPAAAAIAGKQWQALAVQPIAQSQLSPPAGTADRCDFASLDKLPPSHIFTTFNASPAVLARTRHRVEVGGYHRNMAGLSRIIEAFVASDAVARPIIHSSGAHYLAVCLTDDSLMVLGEGRPGSLAQRLLHDDAPDWLTPEPAFANSSLRVYRVR